MIPDIKIILASPGIVDALLAAEKGAGEKRNQLANQDKQFQELLIKTELANLARPNSEIDIQDQFIHESRMIPDPYQNLQGKALPNPLNYQPSLPQDYQESNKRHQPDTKSPDQTPADDEEPLDQQAIDHKEQFGAYIQVAKAGQLPPPMRSETEESADDSADQDEQNKSRYNWLPLALISIIVVLLLLILLH